MEYPPLATKEELDAAFPELAPVSQLDLDALTDDVRGACGWHIAPQVTETVTLESEGERALVLPTLFLEDVLSVTYWNGDDWAPVDSWDPILGWSAVSCSLRHPSGFPKGRVRAEVVHGYPTVPASLKKALAALLSGKPSAAAVVSEGLPGHTLTLDNTTPYHLTLGGFTSSGSLARYKLPYRP